MSRLVGVGVVRRGSSHRTICDNTGRESPLVRSEYACCKVYACESSRRELSMPSEGQRAHDTYHMVTLEARFAGLPRSVEVPPEAQMGATEALLRGNVLLEIACSFTGVLD